jgi:chemosensory pili system protein ChpA (sensor histidine kinase/response regulator)
MPETAGPAGLLRQCADVAQQAVVSGRSAALEQEIGTALLFAETGLEQVRRLPDDFAGNAETIAARLQALLAGEAPPPASAGELSRQIEQGQTVAALADDMKTGLRQVERLLNDYYADGAAHFARWCGPLLRQLQQQLAVLGQDDASAAVTQVDAAVRQLPDSEAQVEQAEELDEIAQNVSALGFFVDMLGRNAQAAKGRFHFDAAAGTFRALPFEKVAAAGAVPVPCWTRRWRRSRRPPSTCPRRGGHGCGDARHLHRRGARRAGLCRQTLALPREQAASGERLAMLRRSFHTLKGSRGSAGAVCRGGRCHRARHEYLAGRGAPGQR